MKAGLLDKRIVIQSQTQTQDTYGAAVVTWATFKTVWADVIEAKNDEKFIASQKMDSVDYKMRIRYVSGVTTSMRVVFNSENYDIKGVQELGRKDGLMLFVALHKNMP